MVMKFNVDSDGVLDIEKFERQARNSGLSAEAARIAVSNYIRRGRPTYDGIPMIRTTHMVADKPKPKAVVKVVNDNIYNTGKVRVFYRHKGEAVSHINVWTEPGSDFTIFKAVPGWNILVIRKSYLVGLHSK